ncbi:winged helix-turn-helix transcriptional regulator [Streptosporangium carneum]|uniref:Transcriptional regulator n=1 Tax=Streptosporangium carneum TaxID=47481 RepID=A0A9W6HZN2_9ACTN|nr:winged helix-turn-helix transcriptional regulator [Streptosporangium carneum]GLK09003.1 transcriptional regulator [Streptosporangium carneum]
MATKRTYGGGCAIADALDLVGERWALLVVRELVLGPKRYTDLQAGLRNASPNVLAQRLRELEEAGVVRRRKLGPPTSSWVYELTEWGLDLEPVLVHLGRWGRRSPRRDRDAETSVDSLVLALRSHFDPDRSGHLRAAYALHIEEDRFSVRVADGRLEISRGETAEPDALIETDARTFLALLTHRQSLEEAAAEGRLRLTGDAEAVEHLLGALPSPQAASTPVGHDGQAVTAGA